MGLSFCSPIYWQAVSWIDTFSLIEFPSFTPKHLLSLQYDKLHVIVTC